MLHSSFDTCYGTIIHFQVWPQVDRCIRIYSCKENNKINLCKNCVGHVTTSL